ncbi:MAG TPA: hypothetical protein DCM23_02710 [Firmicutes bacterium]|nr:hypothetical protein [Bacillota bacterium]
MIQTFMNNKIKFLIAIGALILSSCDLSFVASSTSTMETSTTTSEISSIPVDFSSQIEALTIDADYINENYLLPTLADSGTMVSWSCEDMKIDDGVLVYSNPSFDYLTSIDATISKGGSAYTHTQSLLVKSQRNAPITSEMPQLNLTLANDLQEPDIYYEDYIRGVANLDHTVNGARENTPLISPFGIRIRGNSTRYFPKRSYRLRFDQNTALLGMAAAKNYILLANHIDKSLIRNGVAQFLSYLYPETMHPLDFRFIELTINREYMGQYFMMERVEFQKNRWNIESDLMLDDAGFLLELDYRAFENGDGVEDGNFFWLDYRPYFIREPDYVDPLYVPARHTRYIKEYMFSVNDALNNGLGYELLIDVDNFIDFFMLQEIMKNVDVNFGSLYLFKETGQPLRMSPLWDFDISLGNGDYFPSQAEGHWGWTDFWGDFDNNNNLFFTKLMEIPTFRNQFIARLNDFQNRVLPILNAWLDANHQRLIDNAARNLEKWPLELCDGPWCPIPIEQREFETYEQHLDFVKNFINTRVEWMLNNITLL